VVVVVVVVLLLLLLLLLILLTVRETVMLVLGCAGLIVVRLLTLV
jgi:hypothetical protein